MTLIPQIESFSLVALRLRLSTDLPCAKEKKCSSIIRSVEKVKKYTSPEKN
jgi:hypothetical protein